jgi:hypothetical protein
MCKEMSIFPVNREVDPKRIIGKNGGPRRRRGTRGRRQKRIKKLFPGDQTIYFITPDPD